MTGRYLQLVKTVESQSCEELCLMLIAKVSPLYPNNDEGMEFFEVSDRPNATLGDVRIDNNMADNDLRNRINAETGAEYSPNTFSAQTTIDSIFSNTCVGS